MRNTNLNNLDNMTRIALGVRAHELTADTARTLATRYPESGVTDALTPLGEATVSAASRVAVYCEIRRERASAVRDMKLAMLKDQLPLWARW